MVMALQAMVRFKVKCSVLAVKDSGKKRGNESVYENFSLAENGIGFWRRGMAKQRATNENQNELKIQVMERNKKKEEK